MGRIVKAIRKRAMKEDRSISRDFYFLIIEMALLRRERRKAVNGNEKIDTVLAYCLRSYGFANNNSWTSEAASGSNHYNVNLNNGNVNSNSDSNSNNVMCQRGVLAHHAVFLFFDIVQRY